MSTPKSPKIPESALVIIHSAALEILLIERVDCHGFWQSVTGSKNAFDEPMPAVAAREVFEETGIQIGSPRVPWEALRDWEYHIEYDIYPQWRHRYAAGVVRNIEHWFSVEVPRDIPIVLAPREHRSYQWLPWQAAAQRCFSPSNSEAIWQLAQHRA